MLLVTNIRRFSLRKIINYFSPLNLAPKEETYVMMINSLNHPSHLKEVDGKIPNWGMAVLEISAGPLHLRSNLVIICGGWYGKSNEKKKTTTNELTGFVDVEQLSLLSMAVVFLFWKFSIMVATSPLINSELPQFIELMGFSLGNSDIYQFQIRTEKLD